MFIYYLLHSLYRPLEREGFKQMINGVKTKTLDDKIEVDLKPYLEDLYFKEVGNILITNKGIFSLFIVNLEGQIIGNTTGSKWIERHNHEQIYIPNPIIYNKKRIDELKEKINLKEEINNLVVFINNNTLTIKANNTVYINNLKNYLIKFEAKHDLSDDEVDSIYNVISNLK